MSATDFIFQGKPPPSVNTYGTNTAAIPQWLSDYTQGIANKANAVAGQPYQPYNNQRIAAPNADLKQSWQDVRSNQGSYKPMFNQAGQQFNEAAGGNAQGAAQPYLNQASQQWSQGAADQYMSPYINSVVDRIGDLGARNLSEKLMPAIGDDFIRAGQYGSARMQQETGKALRDTQESVLAQQNAALNQNYSNAQQAFQADQSRIAGVGQTVGNFNSIDTRNNIDVGKAQMDLGRNTQSAGAADALALGDVGREQMFNEQKNLDWSYDKFQQQRDYPKEQLAFANSAIQGIPYTQTNYNTSNAPGTSFQPSGLQAIVGSAQVANAFNNKARGGLVRGGALSRYRDGGLVRRPKASPYRRSA